MPSRSPLADDVLRAAHARLVAGEGYAVVARSLGIRHGQVLQKILIRRGFPPLPVRRKASPIFQVPRRLTDRAYVAGIVDGEGCLSYVSPRSTNSHGGRWMLSVTSTSKPLIDKFLSFGGYVHGRSRTSKKTGAVWKYQWDWFLARREDLLRLLVAIRPYLVIKVAQADRAIRFLQKSLGPAKRPAALKNRRA